MQTTITPGLRAQSPTDPIPGKTPPRPTPPPVEDPTPTPPPREDPGVGEPTPDREPPPMIA